MSVRARRSSRSGSDASSSGGDRSPALISLTRFGKYTLVARLGRGGMAEVFLGFVSGPANFRKPVVIKRILANLQSDERLVEMFFDEARLAARLHHPHVVQTYEVGEIDGSHFLAMEYLEGQPLHRLLRMCSKRRVRMPPPIAVRIVVDALDGLDHAHRLRDFDGTPLDVVHRDVSPQNIFVTYDGVVKMLDFGIAKSVTQVVQTRTGAIKGKYAYIAPEQARSGTAIDPRADLWAMGVVLWESLVGQRLFKGETDVATLEASTRGPIPRLSDALPGAPHQLERIIERALQRDPDRRYPNATAMKSELEHFLRQEPAPVDRAELARYMRKLFGDSIEDHRKLLAACMRTVEESREIADPTGGDEKLGETVPETPPSMDSFVRQAGRTEGSAPPPEPQRRERRRLLPWLAVVGLLLLCGVSGGLVAWVVGSGEDGGSAAVASGPEAAGAGTSTSTPTQAEPPAPAPETDDHPAASDEADPGTELGGDDAVVAAHPPDEAPDQVEQVEAAPEVDRAPAPRRRRWAARRRQPRQARVEQAAGEGSEAEAPAGETGRLTLDTSPWAEVFLEGRSLGTTPLMGVELPAGTHVLTLRNPEQGIETQYRVRVVAGETTRRRLGL